MILQGIYNIFETSCHTDAQVERSLSTKVHPDEPDRRHLSHSIPEMSAEAGIEVGGVIATSNRRVRYQESNTQRRPHNQIAM